MRDLGTKIDNTAPATSGRLSAAEFESFYAEMKKPITSVGMTLDIPTADVDTEMLAQSISRLASLGVWGTGGGTANAQTVTKSGSVVVPKALFTGMRVNYRPSVANTTAATVNVFALGVKKVLSYAGAALTGGELAASFDTCLEYDASLDAAAGAWRILPWASALVSKPAHEQPIVGGVWTWSQSLSDSVQTKITGYTMVQSNLLDATFSSGTLTIGTNTAGQWLLLFSAISPNAGVDVFNSIVVGGGSVGYNTSDTAVSAAGVSSTAIPRLTAAQTVQFDVRQISGGSKTLTGRLHLVKVGG